LLPLGRRQRHKRVRASVSADRENAPTEMQHYALPKNKTMHFIRNNLAVCGFLGIGDRESFETHGFNAQLQCAQAFDPWLPECLDVKALPFDDGAPIPEALFHEAQAWLNKHWKSNSKILISCAGGQSRSVTMAIGLIFVNSQRSFLDCIAEVMEKVPDAYPHPLVLSSAAKYSGDPLCLESLQRVYQTVANPPPYPWSVEQIKDALDRVSV